MNRSFLQRLLCLLALRCLLLPVGSFSASAQSWQWATSPGTGLASGTATDAGGNAVVVGTFNGTATFGATTLTSVGNADVFVAKLTSAGTYLWAVRAGGSSADEGSAVVVDGGGNIYITGNFSGTAVFGPSTISTTSTTDPLLASSPVIIITGSITPPDGYVAKLSSAGVWQWAVRIHATSGASGHALAADGSGNVYVTGDFGGTAIFDATTTLTSSGYYDAFVAKLTGVGRCLWAAHGGGTLTDVGLGLGVDAGSNVYVTGYLQGPTATFGATTLTTNGNYDAFVAKLTAGGVWQWARQVGGASQEWGRDVAVDGIGNVVVTGQTQSAGTRFGTTTLTGGGQVFVAKLTSAGAWLWATRGGSSGSDDGHALAVDGGNNIYVTGDFKGATATFGAATLAHGGVLGQGDVFVARLSPNGQWQWATKAGGSGHDSGSGLAVDGGGSVYVTGCFANPTATFGAATLTNNAGGSSCFISRLARPQISSFSPASGPAGTVVTLTGINLTGASSVKFGGVPASIYIALSATQLNVVVPAGAVTGTIQVTTVGGRATSITPFTVTGARPAPLAVAPEVLAPQLAVYPNPARESVQVLGSPGAPAQLFDALGHLVSTTALTEGTATLDLRNLAAGLYTVRCGELTRRLVVE